MAFAAPVLMMVAMSALELAPAVAIGTGALLGGGLAVAQSAITGQPINPLNVALGAVGGAMPGIGGALGGFGGIADALGLGGAASSGGAAAGGIAETAGAAATEAVQAAAPAATAGIAGPGGTAASAAGTIGAGTIDPVYGSTVVGGSPALGPSSSVPTGAFFSGAGAGGGSNFGSIAKSVLDIGGKASSIGNFGLGAMNFAKQLGGGGGAAPSMGAGMGGRYTTAQAGQYTPFTFEGGLGTAPTPGYLDPAGRFISSKQRQGSLGSLAETVLG